jgi:hypothetical protein
MSAATATNDPSGSLEGSARSSARATLDPDFFDESLRDQFMSFVAGHGMAGSMRPDPIEGWVVELRDGLADGVQVAVEAEYDALMDRPRELADSAEGAQARDLMGVSIIAHNAANPVSGPMCRDL